MLLLFVAMQSAQMTTAAPPRLQLAPMAVKVSFERDEGGALSRCEVALVNDPEPYWRDDPCSSIARGDFLRAMGMPGDLSGPATILLAMEANRQRADPGRIAGRPVYRAEARFALGPGGNVVSCEPGPTIGNGGAVDLCRILIPRGEEPFVRAPDGAAAREGAISVTLYREP